MRERERERVSPEEDDKGHGRCPSFTHTMFLGSGPRGGHVSAEDREQNADFVLSLSVPSTAVLSLSVPSTAFNQILAPINRERHKKMQSGQFSYITTDSK